MPIGAAGASIISGAMGLAGSGLNMLSQGIQNKKNREYADKSYERQKNDELAFWEKNNLYNSPMQQMGRLKEAGLNPNLVYGNGAVANSASAPSAPKASMPDMKAPQFNFDAQSAMMSYYDIKSKTAQTDLLNEQQKVAAQDAILKAVQTANIAQDTSGKEFDLGLKKDLRHNTIAFATENLRKVSTDIDNSISSNRRDESRLTNEGTKLKSDLQDAITNRANTQARTANTKVDTEKLRTTIKQIESSTKMQEIENALAEKGIFRNDPAYMRILNGMAQELTAVNTGWKAFDAIANKVLESLRHAQKNKPKRTTSTTTTQQNGRRTTNTVTH